MAELDRNGVIYIREHPTAYDLKHIGDKIGQLTAISPVIILNKEIIPRKNEREKYWVFLCSCGKKVCRPLRSAKRGVAKDCGCTRDEKTDARYIGKKFGRLMVEERDYAYKFENGLKTKDKYFLCRCDCGNRIVVRLSHLLSGEIVSCGCYRNKLFMQNREESKHEDLSKFKFSMLTPICRDYEAEQRYNYPKTMWKCRCDCGNVITVGAEKLKTGNTKSCGCYKRTAGEVRIAELLDNNGIDYLYDKLCFDDLVLPSGSVGRYDFVLFDESHKPYRIIEFDGAEHNEGNKPSALYSEARLNQIRQYDAIKNEYAMKHGIPLVRIPYSEKGKITLDLLFSDKYLVSV